jgi:predicted enzyme related to lactoylglutathione lyase
VSEHRSAAEARSSKVSVARLSVALDCGDVERQADFWAKALAYDRLFAEAQYVVLGPSRGPAPRMVLQQVPEARVGKNRLHLDLHVRAIADEVARLEALGARPVGTPFDELGHRWQVMTDVEGNEFCVCQEDE